MKTIYNKNNIWAAFAFLSILAPSKNFSQEEMQKGVVYFPFVGFVLGLICTVLSSFLLFFTKNTYLSAFSYLVLMFFLTRGLHYDALADVADAWGSYQRGLRFREILKDSHIGSFGVTILIFYILLSFISLEAVFAYIVLSSDLASQKGLASFKGLHSTLPYFLLIFAPIWGRVASLTFPAFMETYAEQQKTLLKDVKVSQGLSQIMRHKAPLKRLFLWLFPCLVLCFFTFSFMQFCVFSFFSALSFYTLYSLAKREHGYNGDFLGSLLVLWETSVLLIVFIL